MKKIITFLILFQTIYQANAQCWMKISGGEFHTTALKSDGTLWTWGNNYYGQLGFNPNTVSDSNTPIQVGTDNDWVFISAGHKHSLAIKGNGTLWAWGDNTYGQLGVGTNTNVFTPTQIGTDSNWVMVSGGAAHTMGLKKDGTIWTWGWNLKGQLGDGTNVDKNVPVQIGNTINWIQIAAGGNHSLAINSNHELFAFGYNYNGQLGDSSTVDKNLPVKIGLANNWINVAGGFSHSTALNDIDELWSWGMNVFGALGDSTFVDKHYPIRIGNSSDWTDKFSCGLDMTIAIKKNGTLFTWGRNTEGELGDGTTLEKNIPIQIGTNTDWLLVSSGNKSSHAIQNNGNRWAFGLNVYGNLGDSTNTNQYVPELVLSSCLVQSTGALSNDLTLDIFPVPAKGNLNLKSNFRGKKLNIIVTDISGRENINLTIQSSELITIPIESLNDGYYLLSISDGVNSIKRKIVLE